MKSKDKLLIVLIILVVTTFPFTIHNSNDFYEPQEINKSSVGYYQSTTCNISLSEVYFSNLGNERTIKYNPNNYAGIECYGKVTGLDLVDNVYIVSIGTNSLLSFIIQLLIWSLLMKFIRSQNSSRMYINIKPLIFLPIFFASQHLFESRFYLQENKYFNDSLAFNNYYLLTIVLIFYLFFLNLSLNSAKYLSNLINYFPFAFVVVGTFNGLNLNIYPLILSFYGFNYLINGGYKKRFNKLYLIFSFFWLLSSRETITYFDTDKLRGFIGTSNSYESLIYWIIFFGLIINGGYFLIRNSKIDFNLLKNNFLISGTLMVVFGVFGASSSLFNFNNYIFFGQNKRGIQTLESVAGNTWRGFSASAESAGEFFGFIILFYFLCLIYKKTTFHYLDLIFCPAILFGIIKSNNMAAILSVGAVIFVIFLNKLIKDHQKKKFAYLLIAVGFIISGVIVVNNLGYRYVSSELIYEATLHSNLYENYTNYEKSVFVTEFFDQNNLGTLFKIRQPDKISSSLQLLINIYEQRINIPLIPNIVSVISLTAVLINRTEMWGIFIAKYNPSPIEAFFGNGPNQLNNYLYSHKVRLDLPDEKLLSLFLPHSSFLDLIVFFGLIGVTIIGFILFRTYTSREIDRTNIYLLSYLILNTLKSDSILYVNSVMLFITTFTILYRKIEPDND